MIIKMFKEYIRINESKNYQNLYHIIDFNKLKFILENDLVKPYKASNGNSISTTRDKMMNSYLGDSPTSFIKLELNGDKISNKFKIKPYSYKSLNGIRFDEREEIIKLTNRNSFKASDYIEKIIIIKNRIEKLKKSNYRDEEVSIPYIIKYIVENSPYPIYVQDGAVIKKDEQYLQSLINHKIHKVEFKYDIWYRGFLPSKKYKYGLDDVMIDSNGNKIYNLVIGNIYNTNKLTFINKDEIKKPNKKLIQGEKFEPYLIKFRKLKNGKYYLEDIRPLSWIHKNLIN
jgi:hypothetical protein